MKRMIFSIALTSLLWGNAQASEAALVFTPNLGIIIREACQEDLAGILALDRDVSFEFFRPVYQWYTYPSRNADQLLAYELEQDEITFAQAIRHEGSNRLFVAYDKHLCCGLILMEELKDKNVELALLLVSMAYRNKGVGSQLVLTALQSYPEAEKCLVYPLQAGNDQALKFYEKLKFTKLGLGPKDKINCHGSSYEELYYEYVLNLKTARATVNEHKTP